MSNANWFKIFVLVLFNIGCIACFYIGRFDAEKMLAQVKAAYQEQDPRDFLELPDEQKEDCLIWAFGKEWESIKWSYRDGVFRDLHPELNPEDFAGYTEMNLFWRRLEKAYLDRDRDEL